MAIKTARQQFGARLAPRTAVAADCWSTESLAQPGTGGNAGSGQWPQIRHPVRFSGDATVAMQAPPTLGQHTDAVLGEMLGLPAHEIAALRQQGLV
ncbi:MAG: hypothetical protein HHJ12_18455 [Glaciimonas sp.]|nr:hypothetical protein [Glaciimonas sp.]